LVKQWLLLSFTYLIMFHLFDCLMVQPKMKILIIFSTSSFFSDRMSFFLMLNAKEYILKNDSNQSVDGHH